jgi:MerR family transcriptional regulator, redox-sensitive transcriptional activator SoxR
MQQPQQWFRSRSDAVTSHEEIRRHYLSPGEVARRVGVNVSTLHFYERQGLIESTRTAGNQRRYHRDVLRRVAFIRVSQKAGVSLADIAAALATLPAGRTPTKADWARLSRRWRHDLDERLAYLERLRDSLDGCIGCGCLSLQLCSLYNADDHLAESGTGPVRWSMRVQQSLGHDSPSPDHDEAARVADVVTSEAAPARRDGRAPAGRRRGPGG